MSTSSLLVSIRPLLLGPSLICVSLICGCGGARVRSTEAPASGEVAPGTSEAAPPPTTCTAWDPAASRTTAPLDVGAPPEGARHGGDGLRFCILREGESAERPTRESRVRVHYTGWTTDGQMFDSSHVDGEPTSFAVNEVIRGWVDTLTHMRVGQIRRIWVPEELAYRGASGSPAGMLVFDIELVAIE